jgi:hypothetical protein
VDASITAQELIRPWRRATILAIVVAAVELVLLLGAGALLLARPLSHLIQRHAQATAFAPVKKHVVHRVVVPKPKPAPVAKPKHARASLSILVLNGNGHNGAAGTAAAHLRGLGYRIAATGNAKHQNYATTVVLYRAGYAAEATRLAHDVGAKVVGPLDGLAPAALHGGELAVILGA